MIWKNKLAWLSCLVALPLAGCPSIDVDAGEGTDLPQLDGPTVEFDPAAAVIPFPNDLVRGPGGIVALPAQPCESPTQAALRSDVLNQLDGFGTFESALLLTLTEPANPASLAGRVRVYRRTADSIALDPTTAVATAVRVRPGVALRFASDDCASPSSIDALTVVPLVPLEQRSTYVVVVTAGIETADNEAYLPSTTWALIRQSTSPVILDGAANVVENRTPLDPRIPEQLEQLRGLAQLWQLHAPMLEFLDGTDIEDRSQILIAWEFTTQTVTDPLDPTVAGSPAASVADAPLAQTGSITGGATAEQFLQAILPPGTCSADNGPLPCQAVGDVLGAVVVSPNFQQPTDNPLPGGGPVPGAWSHPVHPATVGDEQIQVIAFVPASAPPAAGYPTVVFGHDLTRSKNDLAALAPQLAAQGIASVAIDSVSSGTRAVQTSADPSLGCGDDPSPSTAPQCFASILSANLAITRDNLRQTAIDNLALIRALEACSAPLCGSLVVDADRVMYMGQFLGGAVGTLVASSVAEVDRSVLNASAAGIVDLFENTESLGIRCGLVDALIAAGVVRGDASNLAADPPTGLCTTDDWKTQPGYLQFSAVARWVLDPADGANFANKLSTRRFLVQQVAGDQVVPNIATDTLGLLGQAELVPADCASSPTPPPTAAIVADAGSNHLVVYADASPAQCAPAGNAYAHGSLLSPAPSTPAAAGQLGTARMQTDAITYLLINP